MTRDKAMDICLAATRNGCTRDHMEDFIDMATALGMLKLDEPKSDCETKLYYAMGSHYQTGLATFKSTLADAGLKIVEK